MDHQAKLRWADKHLNRLNLDFWEFLNSEPYVLHTEHHPDKRKHLARLLTRKPIPPKWSLMVGDILHNMRSALDNLTYALAVKKSGSPSERDARRIQFPICDDYERFQAERHRLEKLSDSAATAIETLQPYMGPDPTHLRPLAMLRDLSNRDKHRHILLTGTVIRQLLVTVWQPTGRLVYHGMFQGPFEDSTVVLEFPDADGQAHAEMDVDHLTSIDVAFSKERPAEGREVRPLLRAIHDHIGNKVFPTLEPFLV